MNCDLNIAEIALNKSLQRAQLPLDCLGDNAYVSGTV